MDYKGLMKRISSGDDLNILILYGDETYLIDSAVKSIVNKYIDKSFRDINFISYESLSDNENEFYGAVTTFPFMSDKKVVVVENADFFTSTEAISKSLEKKLTDLISMDNLSSIVIFIIKNKKPDTRKKIVKVIKDNGNLCEIRRLDENELGKWIADRFKKKRITINMANANYIALNSGYLDFESNISLLDIENEVQKMISYVSGKDEINRQDIDNIMVKSIDSNIFKLVDSICENKKNTATQILEEMLLNNIPEQYIIHMIVRQYRMIYRYQILSAKKMSMMQIIDEMKVKKFIAQKLANASKGLSIEKTEKILDKLLEIDRKIKTGEIDKRLGLEIVVNGI